MPALASAWTSQLFFLKRLETRDTSQSRHLKARVDCAQDDLLICWSDRHWFYFYVAYCITNDITNEALV